MVEAWKDILFTLLKLGDGTLDSSEAFLGGCRLGVGVTEKAGFTVFVLAFYRTNLDTLATRD